MEAVRMRMTSLKTGPDGVEAGVAVTSGRTTGGDFLRLASGISEKNNDTSRHVI